MGGIPRAAAPDGHRQYRVERHILPCTGCVDCGATSDPGLTPHHADNVYRTGDSNTYLERVCFWVAGHGQQRFLDDCDFGSCIAAAALLGDNRIGRCEVLVSYA